MKIIVIGAGVGGLYAAKLLSEQGHSVTVYEKSSYESLSYDWRDDIGIADYNKVNLPLPSYHCHVDPVSFCLPHLPPIRMPNAMAKTEWHIERREFSQMLATLATDSGACICYNSKVTDLLKSKGRVTGVKVNGITDKADLIIDSSGIADKQLPETDVFNVYRAFVKPACKEPKIHRKKIYIKHCVPNGVSWCVVEPDGQINILVGRLGPMTKEDFKTSLTKLKEDNPIISDDIIRGGGFYKIPICKTNLDIVSDGYALLGDAAFMTIPLIGSGIDNSLIAAQFLAETINENPSTDIANLWNYQVRYFQEVAPMNYVIDGLRDTLLYKQPLNFLKAVHRMQLSKRIPKRYNKREIKHWKKSIDK